MYVVARGQVSLHKNGHQLTVLGCGACVGELGILQYSSCAGKHLASATAITDCVMLAISRNSLDQLIQSTAGIATGVLDALASSLKWSYFQVLISDMHSIT